VIQPPALRWLMLRQPGPLLLLLLLPPLLFLQQLPLAR
jgi:hypothetical protein